jgi:hypothetical protein
MQHMNPSRDIEKLFDQFGGDASSYQEIGRENEASHARTRWPLLATLDLSQPSIPSISQNRDSLLSPGQNRSTEPRKKPWGAPAESEATSDDSAQSTPATATAAPAFTRDTRPRLFSRPNRKTIPPVANVALPGSPVGAERFSALVDAVEGVSNVEETPVIAAPAAPDLVARPQPRLQTQAAQPQLQQQQQSSRPTLPRSQPLSTPEKLPGATSAFQMQRPQPAAKPSLPRIQPTQPVPEPKAHSILGKLFGPQSPGAAEAAQAAQEVSAPRPDSLKSMFERLREPAAAVSSNEAPAAGSWLAKRASQS